MPIPSAPFNTADSLVNGLSVLQFKPANTSKTGTAIAITTGVATATAHGLKVGQQFVLTAVTGGTGLTANSYYWVITAPTADTFTFSETRGGTLKAPSVAATAFTVQPVHVFEVAKLSGKGTAEEKTLERPNFQGISFKVRSWQAKGSEEWSAEIDDVKRLLLVLNNSLRGYLTGTATIWSPDITDISTKCALVSETDFACVLTVDGDINTGGGENTKATLKFTSNKNGYVTWTSDATV